MRSLIVIALAAAGLLLSNPASAEGVFPPVSTTLHIDDGRPVIDLTIVGPTGSAEGRFLVDTGGGAFMIPEGVARAVGLSWSATFREEGNEFARPETLPTALLEGLSLGLNGERVLVPIDRNVGLLPGHVLAQYHVIFDYPGRTLTIASPGSVEPIGAAQAMPVSRPMGFPRTEIRIGKTTYGLLLDTGPAATIISEAVADQLGRQYMLWEYQDGAHHEAQALQRAGGRVLGTLVAQQVEWGDFEIGPVTMASQPEGTFERWISRMMTDPVVGALGSNVFKDFRLELDYLNQTLYLSRSTSTGR